MSIRFVAGPLGHSSAAFTLEIYAHLLPVEVGDMGFAEFGRPSGVTKRHYTSPEENHAHPDESPEPVNHWNETGKLERETGFEPATLSLGSRSKRKQ